MYTSNAHMEGPFLSEKYVGANKEKNICKPSIFALNERINTFENDIAIVTLAPELKGYFDLIRRLRKLNILVSLGHFSADYESAIQAFNYGVNMITHTFNAIKGLHHQAVGPIGAAIYRDEIFLGLIADGIHVHADMIKILNKIASMQIVLVSDAISAYGLGYGTFDWDNRLVTADKGLCRLSNQTIALSTLLLFEACKKIAKWVKDPFGAIWMATVSPRMVLAQKKITVRSLLIGKNINYLLRWKINSCNHELSWQLAA